MSERLAGLPSPRELPQLSEVEAFVAAAPVEDLLRVFRDCLQRVSAEAVQEAYALCQGRVTAERQQKVRPTLTPAEKREVRAFEAELIGRRQAGT